MQPTDEQTPEVYQDPLPEAPELEQVQEISPVADLNEPLSWQASEYIHHEKSSLWFFALLGIALVLLLIDIFLIKSWTFGALIVVMAAGVAIIARRPPQDVSYSLNASGITIGEKQFSFHDFRAFGIAQEDALSSIRLIPSKRFMPAVNVFFPPEYGEQIVDIFGSMLPMEKIEPDIIDTLSRKIHF